MSEDLNPAKDHKSIIFGVGALLWPRNNRAIRIRVCIALGLVLFSKPVAVAVPFVLKVIIDGFAAATFTNIPLALLLAFGTASLIIQLSNELRKLIFTTVAQHSIRTIALKAFNNLQYSSASFHNDRKTGGIIRAVERGTGGIEFLLETFLFDVLPTLLELALIIVVIAGLFDLRYSLVVTITAALYLVFTYIATKWQLGFRRKKNELDISSSVQLVDSLLNHDTIKYFTNETHESDKYYKVRSHYEKATVNHQKTDFAVNFGRAFIVAIGSVGVLIMAAQDLLQGDLTVGDFVMLNSYLVMLFAPISTFMMAYNHSKQAFTDIEALQRILMMTPDIKEKDGALPLKIELGHIRFDRVTFGYDPQSPILKDASFKIEAGKTTAIVGASGSGKSTITKLLFRFYDIQEGVIEIDGQNIADVTKESLRSHIGVVPQEPALFNDTIFYNIHYGDLRAQDSAVYEAAEAAQLHGLINNSELGLETRVGEHGMKLSGGEKQRVALARAILKKPTIYVFDEATSALDTHTEKEIMENLKRVARDHTTLIIAHRLSTIVDADKIIVLEKGRILESGCHETLLELGGAYAQLWTSQSKKTSKE